MPERFDNLLSGAVDDAGRAAHAPGAAAARARGRRLRNQRRVTAAALSLLLLAGVGTAAAVTLSGRNGGTATATVTSSSPTAPASSGLRPSTATSPSGTSASPSRPSSPATTPSISQSSTKIPGPGTLVANAWLSADQLPFGTGYQGSRQVTAGSGTLLGDSVYQVSTPMAMCNEDMPGTALTTALAQGLTGEQHREFFTQGIAVTSQVIAGDASQQTYFYPSSGAAQSAWDALPAAFAACKQQMTGTNPTTGLVQAASVQRTVSGEADAACWSTLTMPQGVSNAHGNVTHTCFVQKGSLITAVTITLHEDDSFSTVPLGSIDQATISALRQALSAYGVTN